MSQTARLSELGCAAISDTCRSRKMARIVDVRGILYCADYRSRAVVRPDFN
jgi:hypothetical protein